MTGVHHLSADAVPACLDDVHELLAAVWQDAPEIGATERARFTLVTAELVANVVEHGGAGRSAPPHLQLDVEVRGGAISGTLSDDGAEPPRGAPGGRKLSVPDANEPPRAPISPDEIGALRESGRGLLLVRSIADSLALTRDGDRNRWRYVVRPRSG